MTELREERARATVSEMMAPFPNSLVRPIAPSRIFVKLLIFVPSCCVNETGVRV